MESSTLPLTSSSTTPLPLDDGDDDSSESSHWTVLLTLRVVLQIIVTVLTLMGNGFVLGAIAYMNSRRWKAKHPVKASSSHTPVFLNSFVINLAVADLLVGLVVQPFMITTLVGNNRWYFGESFCVMYQILIFWFCSASILLMCVIAIDRYIGVTRPLHYTVLMTRRRRIVLICGVWIVSLGLNLGPLLVWPVVQEFPDLYCAVTTEFKNTVWIVVTIYVIPAVFVVLAYGRIYLVVRAKRKAEEAQAEATSNGTIHRGTSGLRIHRGGTSTSVSATKIEAVKFRKHSEGTKTLVIIVGAYLLCWGPAFTALFFVNSEVRFPYIDEVLDMSMVLGLANSCVNPIIYIISSKSLRQILRGCVNKLRRPCRVS